MVDWIGKKLGRVHIESLLARGGMAEVYLGTHTTLQRRVAVKILRNYFTEDLRPHERFELEARAVAKLRHPNIVQVFDFDTVDDQPYLVMEYIPGPPLSQYLAVLHAKDGRLGLPLISRLLTRIADALQYAHESGVIHRDVKPGNILLTSRSIRILPGETLPLDLEPVLTDFGLVRFLNASRQTASGLITGTPAYMSPEQAMGQATDVRTDIYSLGIVLYEMLSGKVPFDAESTMSILLKHLHEPPPPIPGLSPALQNVLDRALAKNPEDRFQKPEELAAAFNHALDNTSQASTLVTLPQILEVAKENRVSPSKRQRSWLPAILLGALILLAGAALLFNRQLPAANAGMSTTSSPTIIVSDTPSFGIPVTFGPTGNLHFEDGNAILDRATLIAQGMPAPPSGRQYEVWLVSDNDRLMLGTLQLDGTGKGQLIYDDPQNRNLLQYYEQVEVTHGPDANPDPNSATEIAYASALPESGLTFLRRLMVSFSSAPEEVGLIHGLTRNAELIDKAAKDLLSDYQVSDEAGVREDAESILNLLNGVKSTDHKDWDSDGQVTDPGDGYGFFINSNNLGYIQAVYSHADYAVNSPGASRNMIVNGENAKICTQNLAQWAPELRGHMQTILGAAALSGLDSVVQRSAELADQMLNGIDQNENGTIEPLSAECGIMRAYEYTYLMADMPLLPIEVQGTVVSVSETATTPTTTPSSRFAATATPTRRPNTDQSPSTVAPVNPAPATSVPATSAPATSPPVEEPPPPVDNEPKPTKEPKPTNEPNPPGPPDQDPKPTKKN